MYIVSINTLFPYNVLPRAHLPPPASQPPISQTAWQTAPCQALGGPRDKGFIFSGCTQDLKVNQTTWGVHESLLSSPSHTLAVATETVAYALYIHLRTSLLVINKRQFPMTPSQRAPRELFPRCLSIRLSASRSSLEAPESTRCSSDICAVLSTASYLRGKILVSFEQPLNLFTGTPLIRICAVTVPFCTSYAVLVVR